MTYRENEDMRLYRTFLLIFTAVCILGELATLYIYRYTDVFKRIILISEKNQIHNHFDIDSVAAIFYNEILFIFLIFIFGFTLFSPFVTFILSSLKGVLYGYSVLFYTNLYINGNAPVWYLISVIIITSFTALASICIASKSYVFSSSLRYATPSFTAMIKQSTTKRYIITFLVISAFVFCLSLLRCLLDSALK